MRPGPFLLLLPVLAGCPQDADKTPRPVAPPSFLLTRDPLALTELAVEAVAAAPTWVQDDLAINLAALESALQDELAVLYLDLEEPWISDEVAFSIAHTSPEVLESSRFYPELFVENARFLYAVDETLEYVALVDEGEPGVDADWSTTAAYRVETAEGVVEERTIERDLYYWYVVHPRIEDEIPYFLDAWRSSSSVAPEDGMFWREFLWDQAAEECPAERDCPLLADRLAGVDVLWKSKAYNKDDNGAIGALVQYVQDALDFGAGSERPVQPSRVYTVKNGNCGEHADLSCAAARVGLIPCQNVGARSNDHTWNEFWDERWVSWEPVNTYVEHWYYYADGNGDYYRTRDGLDNDCDGTADDETATSDNDGDGLSAADGDCNDTDAGSYPGAPEVADGRDNDCNGIADDGLEDLDADGDGDGFSIAEGDCDERDRAVFPGAEELANGRDDDCDGIADDGTDLSDVDADGWTVADGDCDDGRADAYPGAPELADGRDEDCNGLADDGYTAVDRDGDGLTMAEGDCDDTRASVVPGAADPAISTNRLYAITATRGDTYVTTDRTVDYGTPSYLEFTVTDDDGQPVDGAVVHVFGTWSVYGYPDYPAYAGEVMTDLDGRAVATVGEANTYYWAVMSDLGDAPGGQRLYNGPTWTDPEEIYSFEASVDGLVAPHPEVTEADLTGGAAVDATLALSWTVTRHSTAGNGGYYDLENDYYPGSFRVQGEGGRLDAFVVDHDNFTKFAAGEPFEAMAVRQGAVSDETTLDVPLDRTWTLVLANAGTAATTMIGTVALAADPASGTTWSGDAPVVEASFRIPPGEYWATVLLP